MHHTRASWTGWPLGAHSENLTPVSAFGAHRDPACAGSTSDGGCIFASHRSLSVDVNVGSDFWQILQSVRSCCQARERSAHSQQVGEKCRWRGSARRPRDAGGPRTEDQIISSTSCCCTTATFTCEGGLQNNYVCMYRCNGAYLQAQSIG